MMKSKHIWCLGLALLFAFALSAVAADDALFYNGKAGIAADPTLVGNGFDVANQNNQNTAFRALSDCSLTLQVKANANNATFTFGTFIYDDDGNKSVNWTLYQTMSSDYATLNGETMSQNGGTGALLTTSSFSAGDVVGVWIQLDGEDKLYYSLDSLTSQSQASEHYAYTKLNGEKGTGAGTTWDGVTIYFNPTGANGSGQDSPIVIAVTAASAVSGSPLPGVLATMLLCGLGGVFIKKRKRNK